MSVIRYAILILRKVLRQNFLFISVQVNPVQSAVRQDIKHLFTVIIIYHSSQFILGNGKRFGAWNKCFFLNHIVGRVKIINVYAYLAFVYASAHISVYGKRQITVVIHTDNPDGVLVVPAPLVAAHYIRKAEYLVQFICFSVIEPEVSLLHKRYNRLVFICLILQIAGRDPKKNSSSVYRFRSARKYFLHIPVIIQKINGIFQLADAEKLFYIVHAGSAVVIRAGHLVFCEN